MKALVFWVVMIFVGGGLISIAEWMGYSIDDYPWLHIIFAVAGFMLARKLSKNL
ncbi:MAG: hypothetical protein ACOCWG_01980 [bacterium]